jgi:branched-chain amino acid transport system ATP-binding protein
MAILDIHQVSLSFGGLKALQNVNLKIEKGATHALIGPNGAGKSTLLNVLTGMLKPDDGSVMLTHTTLTSWVLLRCSKHRPFSQK